jgi:hypothetical protein
VITFSLFGVGTATVQPTISAGPAAELRIGNADPQLAGASGAAFDAAPQIRITDSGGNLITDGSDSSIVVTATLTRVTVSGQATGGFVIGEDSAVTAIPTSAEEPITQVTVSAINGVATFGGLGIDGVNGRSYTLTYSSNSLAGISLGGVQQALVRTGGPVSVEILTTAGGADSGAPFSRQPRIVVRDSGGNPVNLPVTVSASVNPVMVDGQSTGVLVGSPSVQTVNGVATFSDLGLSGVSGTNYTITFNAEYEQEGTVVPLAQTSTQTVTAAVGAPVALEFATAPAGAASGLSLATQPVVRVVDSGGNTVSSSTAEITVKIDDPEDGLSGQRLLGATTAAAVDGVGRVTNLGLRGIVSTDYTLTFQAVLSGEERSLTEVIAVSPGVPASFAVSTSAAGAASGLAFTSQPQIRVMDAEGNTVTASQARVTVTVSGADQQGRQSRQSRAAARPDCARVDRAVCPCHGGRRGVPGDCDL